MNKEKNKTFLLNIEYVEIYNEKVYDLLGTVEDLEVGLQINEDMVKKEFYIKGATQVKVEDIKDILSCLEGGESNRHYAST